MLKTILTLMRGAAAAAEEEVVDRNALLILDQQIRDAAGAIERGKRALALAIAHDEAEGKRLDSTLARIADLEERATAALTTRADATMMTMSSLNPPKASSGFTIPSRTDAKRASRATRS